MRIEVTEAKADFPSEPEFIPGYQVVRKIGEGGMGVVYQALQVSLNRQVAIKVVKGVGNQDTDFKRRFQREAIAGALLNHPNIVAVYDHGNYQNTVYMVLEFVEGRDCSEILKESGPFEERFAFELARDVVLGLSHACAAGVIHRDIKPANIMVADVAQTDARQVAHGAAKIMDFGIASLRESVRGEDATELTQMGTVVGTPGYMSPEQAMGKGVDFRADIYSLGSTLYYFLVGSAPWPGETAIEVFHNKMTSQIPSPADLASGVTQGAVQVIARMMARDANDRYQSYEDLLSDIEAVLKGEQPSSASIPLASQSIAPSEDGEDLDQTELAATIQASAAVLSPPTPARRGAASSGLKSRKTVWAACAIAVVLLACVVGLMVWQSDGKVDDRETKNKADGSASPKVADEPAGNGESENIAGNPPPLTPAPLTAAEKAKAAAVECKLIMDELESMPDDEFAGELVSLRENLAAKQADLMPRQRRALRRSLRELLNKRGRAMGGALIEKADAAWQIGDYEAMGKAVAQTESLLRDSFELIADDVEKVAPRLAELRKIRNAALGEGLGSLERDRWTKTQATSDPVETIRLLADFESSYWFSPVLSEARTRLAEAQAAAPHLEITTIPRTAMLTVNTRELGNDSFSGPIPKGSVSLKASAAGFYALDYEFEHQEKSSKVLRLSPRPATVLKIKGRGLRHLPFVGGARMPVKADWSVPVGAPFGILSESAAIELENEKGREGWSDTGVRLQPFLDHRMFKDRRGFAISVVLGWTKGRAEVRLSQQKGQTAVVGCDAEGYYYGTQSDSGEDIQRLPQLKLKPGIAQAFSLEWHGDVLVIRDGFGENSSVVGSLKFEGAQWTRFALAAKESKVSFGDLRIYPMTH